MGVLNEYKAAHPAAPQALARKMDGALLAIGTLSDVLKVGLLRGLVDECQKFSQKLLAGCESPPQLLVSLTRKSNVLADFPPSPPAAPAGQEAVQRAAGADAAAARGAPVRVPARPPAGQGLLAGWALC